jgi:hypothetical protein
VTRNTRELGRPNSFLVLQRGKQTDQSGELMMSWESDQLIVLSERESRLQGEGAADVIRSQQRKH